ncbi:Outer membrane protein transport protein (OMPP1/FadL/TodX) [Thiorhodovibrio winogradskyi]|uniref:Outer membrane protein transport protein (OMPP1/FadL/TodX) n=1 Tax=Thiorhodovibrio winogradskyi TaxID=77007 RepID=A0ABZ0S925_9GAMM|nr:outer membrane protein transport protein [Thiorhodovibrio winogradskyi]
MKSKTLAAAITVACSVLVPSIAQATNGYFSHGYGTKNKGMAGAGTALPQDAMISAVNVAGVVWVDRRMDVGLTLFSPHREYTQRSSTNNFPPAAIAGGMAPPWPVPVGSNPDFTGTVDSEENFFLIPHFAYAHPLDDSSALGVSLYGNGGMNTSYDRKDTTALPGTPGATGLGTYGGAMATPAAASTGVDLSQLALNLNYSRKLTDDFSLGGGLILSYQRFKARGLTPFGMLVSDGNPDNLSNKGYEGVFGWGAQIGALWKVNEQFSIGAAYQTKIDFEPFDDYSDLFAGKGDLDAPAFVNVGLAFKPRQDITLAFDIQHIWYSDVDALGNNTTSNLSLCLAGQTQHCLGANDGPGFGWEDMTVYKFGVQWDYKPDLTFRAGYSYGEQPVPSESVLFNVLAPAVIEQHFTLGLTKQIGKNMELNFAGMYAPKNDVDCGCSLPFSGGADSINIAMSQWELEMSVGLRF